jgi:hypothetical protein
MALAVVQMMQAQSGSSVASITTTGVTTTSGNLLVAMGFVGTNNFGTPPISDSKGNTWTQAVAPFGNVTFLTMYYVANCTGGASHTFTFTPASNGFIAIVVLEISGAATSSVIGSTNTSTASVTTHNSGNITSNGSVPEIFVGAYNTSSTTQPINVTAPYWAWQYQKTDAAHEGTWVGYRIVDPSVTDAFTVLSAGSGPNPICIAGFKSATALATSGGGSYGFA